MASRPVPYAHAANLIGQLLSAYFFFFLWGAVTSVEPFVAMASAVTLLPPQIF